MVVGGGGHLNTRPCRAPDVEKALHRYVRARIPEVTAVQVERSSATEGQQQTWLPDGRGADDGDRQRHFVAASTRRSREVRGIGFARHRATEIAGGGPCRPRHRRHEGLRPHFPATTIEELRGGGAFDSSSRPARQAAPRGTRVPTSSATSIPRRLRADPRCPARRGAERGITLPTGSSTSQPPTPASSCRR